MILSLLVLFGLEATMLWSTLVRINSPDKLFELVMSIVLSSVYGLSILIYIPLFVTVMERLRVAFPQVHQGIKQKVNLIFTLLLLLLFIRYFIYLSMDFASFKFFNIS
jgi:hypothetical protein